MITALASHDGQLASYSQPLLESMGQAVVVLLEESGVAVVARSVANREWEGKHEESRLTNACQSQLWMKLAVVKRRGLQLVVPPSRKQLKVRCSA
jgi:hypothetical protein